VAPGTAAARAAIKVVGTAAARAAIKVVGTAAVVTAAVKDDMPPCKLRGV
jgi:hypothetical protein